MAHVGDERRRALAKTDEHAVLGFHLLDSEPCTAAISPRRTEDRIEPQSRVDTGHARKRFRYDALLEWHLGRVAHVLQRAAPADAEIFAWRGDTLRGRLDDPHELGILIAPAPTARYDGHA